jgi:WD40 repeat protein
MSTHAAANQWRLASACIPATLSGLLLLASPGTRSLGQVRVDQPDGQAPDVGAVDEALKSLSERMVDRKEDIHRLRSDLLSFRRTCPGSAQAITAAGFLRQLPSPLDNLDPETIPALERYDWQPKELVALLGEHRGRHGGVPSCLAFTPDGKTVISGGNNAQMRFWESATMRLRSTLAHSHYLYALTVSRDGHTLACGGEDGLVRLWDLTGKEPKERATLKTAASPVYALAMSRDGTKLAWNAEGGAIRLWDLRGKEPKELELLRGHKEVVRALAFAPDGKTLASGSQDHTVRLWDLTRSPARARATIPAHNGDVRGVSFSSDGKLLASGDLDGALWLWNVAGAPKQRAMVKIGGIYALAFAPNGKTLAAGCADGTTHLLDLAASALKERVVLRRHVGYIASLAFAPDGKSLATGGGDCTVRLWPLVGGQPLERTVTRGHLCHAHAAVFAPDGALLTSVSEDGTLRMWDVKGTEAKERTALKSSGGPIYAVAFSPDGKLLVTGHNDTTVRLWQVAGTREIRQLKDSKDRIWSVAFLPNGKQVVSASGRVRADGNYWIEGEGPSLRLWDVASGQQIRRFGDFKEPIRCMALSPDGARLATGCVREELRMAKYVPIDCAVRWWDVATGEELSRMELHERPVYSVAFSMDGRSILSSSIDAVVRRWTPGVAGKPTILPGTGEYVISLAASPDGKTIAGLGYNGKLLLWGAASGEKLREWQFREYGLSVAFAPDSRHLAVGLVGGPIYILRLSPPASDYAK